MVKCSTNSCLKNVQGVEFPTYSFYKVKFIDGPKYLIYTNSRRRNISRHYQLITHHQPIYARQKNRYLCLKEKSSQ